MNRLIGILLFAFIGGAVGRTAPPSAPSAIALAELFRPGVLLQDRNGDGAIDFVNARVALPDNPSPVELAAAADVAARLGFESSAMNLPVVRALTGGAEIPTIFVGVRALADSGVTAGALGSSALKAGDGLVTAFTSGGQPSVAVLGGDDNGLTAAAVMFAGHLPYVWDAKGPTTDKVGDDVKEFLSRKGITASSAAATSVYVRHDSDGAERLVVDLQLAAAGDLIKAQVALNQLIAASGRDAKRLLSYPTIRTVRVRLHAPAAGLATVDLPRAAPPDPPAQPPARRPGGGA
jgi:hypothetical protein